MQTYETILITTASLDETEEQTVISGLAEVIEQGGGTMVFQDRMGRRRLAYPIRKQDDGVYTRFLYDSTADVPPELERRARINDKVLRWMTVRLEDEWARDAKSEAAREITARAEAAEQAEQEAKAETEPSPEPAVEAGAPEADAPAEA